VRPTAIRLRPGEFFGGIERHLDVQDLLLRETRHAASQLIPRHEHEAPHFCLGIEGACRERIHRRDVDCVPGTIEYHPGGTTHASRWEAGGGRCFTVTLGRDWATRMIAEDREIAPRPGLLGREARELMLRLHRELRAPDPASPAVVVPRRRPGSPAPRTTFAPTRSGRCGRAMRRRRPACTPSSSAAGSSGCTG
jgi:hypothetical protein